MKTSLLPLFILTTLISSCSVIRENHYFRDNIDDQADLSNYYKVTVKGRTLFMSKTRYYAGYFDPAAVDAYFNEFNQPKNGRLKDSVSIQPLNPENENKQLVMIMSSNADDFAAQIGNMAQSKETLNSVLSIGNEGNYRRLKEVKSGLDGLVVVNRGLAITGESLIDKLNEQPLAQRRANLLQYVNVLAAQLGSNQTFNSLSAASQWYNQSRSVLINSNR